MARESGGIRESSYLARRFWPSAAYAALLDLWPRGASARRILGHGSPGGLLFIPDWCGCTTEYIPVRGEDQGQAGGLVYQEAEALGIATSLAIEEGLRHGLNLQIDADLSAGARSETRLIPSIPAPRPVQWVDECARALRIARAS